MLFVLFARYPYINHLQTLLAQLDKNHGEKGIMRVHFKVMAMYEGLIFHVPHTKQ